MILAKTKISPKMQNLGESGPYNWTFLFFFYSLPASNLCPKVFTKWHNSSFKKTKFSSLWVGTSPLRHPPVCWSEHLALWCSPPPNKSSQQKIKKMDLGSWLGDTCNFEIGEEFEERFCRQCLALGNNSDFLEESTPLIKFQKRWFKMKLSGCLLSRIVSKTYHRAGWQTCVTKNIFYPGISP